MLSANRRISDWQGRSIPSVPANFSSASVSQPIHNSCPASKKEVLSQQNRSAAQRSILPASYDTLDERLSRAAESRSKLDRIYIKNIDGAFPVDSQLLCRNVHDQSIPFPAVRMTENRILWKGMLGILRQSSVSLLCISEDLAAA